MKNTIKIRIVPIISDAKFIKLSLNNNIKSFLSSVIITSHYSIRSSNGSIHGLILVPPSRSFFKIKKANINEKYISIDCTRLIPVKKDTTIPGTKTL